MNPQFTYTTNNGAITITGYSGTGGAVVIPSTINGLPVASIGGSVFWNQTSLTSVTIPTSITSIGNEAFAYCYSLRGVYFQGNAPSVGLYVFESVNYSEDDAVVYYSPGTTGWGSTFGGLPTALWNPQIPFLYTTNNGTITITRYAGTGGAVTIPTNINSLPVTSIGDNAFDSFNNLTSVTIPGSVTNIGNFCFYECVSLTNVTIPNSVTSIGDEAFNSCGLTSVMIPSSVTNIGFISFGACPSLTAITVDARNPVCSSTNGVLFNKSQTTLLVFPGGLAGSYTVPNSVTSIGEWAFNYCNLTSVSIPKSVTSIGQSAFEQCFSLTNVAIPTSVTSIGFAEFAYCYGLTSITIPNSVTNIGNSAFYGCTNLTGILFLGNAPSVGSLVFSGDNGVDDPVTVYYLSGTTGWGATFAGVTAIEVTGTNWDTVTVSASPSAGGTVSGGGTFVSGTLQKVIATANSGYSFVNWTENGNVVSSSASYTFTLSSNLNLAANFDGGGQILYQTLDDPKAAYGAYAIGGTYAQGISGTNVVGWYIDTNGSAHGFLYNDGAYTTLDDPKAAGNYTLSGLFNSGGTYATGISGTNIVGYYTDTNGFTHGFLYNGSTYTTLDDPNAGGPYSEFYYDVTGGTWVRGISGSNIVGYYTDNSGNVHGFLYTNGNYTTLNDPNAVYAANGGEGTHALSISGGYIVGYLGIADDNGVAYGLDGGFLYNGSNYNSGVGSYINGIEGCNTVGSSGNSGFVTFSNFVTMDGILYTNGNYTSLNYPNGDVTSANGISSNTIVGSYTDGNGVSHGFTAIVINYTITVSTSPGEGGTVNGGGTFISGSSQTVTAAANYGYTFANWTENGNIVSSSASYNVTVISNLNLVANFTGVGTGTSYQMLNDPNGIGYTYALGVSGNNIVGTYENGYYNGFLYNGSNYTTLDVPLPGYPYTIASGISGSNIVGWYTDGADAHGFLYSNGSYTTLDDPNAANKHAGNVGYYPPGGYGPILEDTEFDGYSGTFATGISGSNIVGWYVDGSGYNHGFLYNGSSYTTLDDPTGVGSTYAQGIDGKNIVGWYVDTNGYTHGFLYNGSTYATLDNPNGVGSTYALSISGGNILGYYVEANGFPQAFVYNGGTYTTLPTRDLYAIGIYGNTIVGYGFTDTVGNPQTGSLKVTILPTSAITAGAQWQADSGTWQNSGVTVTNLSVGNHTVGFSTINGWTTPSNQMVSVNANSTTTVSSTYVAETNQLQIRTIGLGTISPNYSNAWLQINMSYSMTATAATGFAFTNWIISTNWVGGVVSNSATLNFVMQSNLTLLANFVETNKPTLTITAPAAGQHMTNALATVTGTTSDKWGVTGVWYQLNNGAWNASATTNGWTNWTTTVELISGTNTMKAYAMNLGGNVSTNSSVSMVSSNTFMLQLAFTNAVPLKTNGLVFSLQLSTGLNGHIQVSTNLTSWATLTNFVGTNSTLIFRDSAATNFSRRFYRAVIP